MTVTAPPLTRERSVEITLLRAKILSPTESPHLVTSISVIVGGSTITPGQGRYGYGQSWKIIHSSSQTLAAIYRGHKHPSATPCIELFSPAAEPRILRQIQSTHPFEVTAVTVSHRIGYLPPTKVVDLCCQAIGHEQGSADYISSQERRGDNSTFSFEREGSTVQVRFQGELRSADSCIVSITVNPETVFRPMLTSQPILGAWACNYWTRALSLGLFGNRDPLDPQFDHLFDEPLALPCGGRKG